MVGLCGKLYLLSPLTFVVEKGKMLIINEKACLGP